MGDARPMRAVKDSLAAPLRVKGENRKTLARANGTSRRASGWAGEKAARSGRPTSPPSREKVRRVHDENVLARGAEWVPIHLFSAIFS